MKTLSVPEMHCPVCVGRITKAMEEAKITCEINLEAQTVTVAESDVAKAIEELEDLGFSAT